MQIFFVNCLYSKLHWTGRASMVRYIKDLHYCMNAERSNAAPTEQDMGLKVTLQMCHVNYRQRGCTQVNEC